MKVLKITGPDINNGLGNRITVWFAGCGHKCACCQNEWTWNYNQGHEMSYAYDKLQKTLGFEHIQGVTFSGGDPLMQDDASLCELLGMIIWIKEKYPSKDIWLYTGYTLSELIESPRKPLKAVLDKIDVLVDGQYKNEQRDLSLAFRGSTNQNIWNMKTRSLMNLDNN